MKNKNLGGTARFPLPLKAVVFDLDGTLMNTLEDIANIANKVLVQMDYPAIEKDKYRYFLGNGAGALLDSIHSEVQMQEKDRPKFDKTYMDLYSQSEIGEETVYPGIFSLLKALKSRGIRLGVLTNKPHHIAIPLMERVFPHTFDTVFGQRDPYPRKPDPYGLISMEKDLAYRRDQMVYIGDTNTDMETGRAYGAFTIGALWGFRDEKELLQAGAHATILAPEDLLDFIQ